MPAIAESVYSGEATLSVCLLENPHRPVTLRSLLVQYGHFFFLYGDMLRSAVGSFAHVADRLEIGDRSDELVQHLRERYSYAQNVLRCLKAIFDDLPLPMSRKGVERAEKRMDQPLEIDATKIAALAHDLDALSKRIGDELDSIEFVHISPEKQSYFFAGADVFGEVVKQAFPSSGFDIVEAGRCFALRRNTGCVFHLMRALEIGLGALCRHFNIPFDHVNWEQAIDRSEKAINNIDKDPTRPTNWRDDREFYSQCASHFRVLKDAWRNYTAHARGKYDEQEALDIFANTRGFMQKLATRLHE